MDNALLQIILAVISGGFLQFLLKEVFDRWREATGKKKTYQQIVYQYQEALARNRLIAIEAGVDPNKLEKDPLLDKK
jgi:hypothetical protein